MKIAYFSMEIGLNENIPTYSGGLGILAGDHIKSAADLNLPLVAVTLLYKRGYFIQTINPMGEQEEIYPYFDPRAFMEPLPFKVTIKIEGRDVNIGVWKYNQIGIKGRVPVYFLDTDLPNNAPEDRLITQFLYGGDNHTRICQEAVLGIGGYLALKRLERDITTYHMNEGHAVFLTLALLQEFGGDEETVRQKCVFTTHTPVPAGHDKFSYDLAGKTIGTYLPQRHPHPGRARSSQHDRARPEPVARQQRGERAPRRGVPRDVSGLQYRTRHQRRPPLELDRRRIQGAV